MTVRLGDATNVTEVADESVSCIVTSPPYNVGIEYGEHYDDTQDWIEYSHMVLHSAREMHRVLVSGGRAWVNVMPSVPVGLDSRINLSGIWLDAFWKAGFGYRDTVIWIQDSHDGGCAWGSWRLPSAPNLRGGYEVILCVFKDHWKCKLPRADTGVVALDQQDDNLAATPWTDVVRNFWNIRPERRRPDAPAPFPPELPARCIRLSTWPGETVLDPFCGSATTIKAAEALGRVGIGFDLGALKDDA